MSGAESAPEVAVVGSINLDLSLRVPHFPQPGETVLGAEVLRGGGGKGANQAVAAARLGRWVAMVGALGGDDSGDLLLRMLEAEGIDVEHVSRLPEVASGLAVIEVDRSGENRIVVASGANGELSPAQLEQAAPLLAETPVILTQLETPIAVLDQLREMPRQGRLVLNPAPAAAVELGGVDILVPNRGELAGLVGGVDATSVDELVDQVSMLADGPEAVVVTLGGDGVLVVDRSGPSVTSESIDALEVEVVDTTAAGDSFCGALADALCLGADVVEAARWAVKVSAVTVTRRGAQSSLPHRSDIVH